METLYFHKLIIQALSDIARPRDGDPPDERRRFIPATPARRTNSASRPAKSPARGAVWRWRGTFGAVRAKRITRNVVGCVLARTTKPSNTPALKALILRDHPYDEPALWAVEMTDGSESFLTWIDTTATG